MYVIIDWHSIGNLRTELFIYAYDRSVIPLVAGFDRAYELSEVRDKPVDATGIGYVTHPYPQKRSPPWEEQWQQDFGIVADRYPVVATEFGFMSADGRGAHVPVIGDKTYGEAIIDFFEQGRFFRDKMRQLNPRV